MKLTAYYLCSVLLCLPILGHSKDKVSIGIADFPPYVIINNDRVSGIDIDIIQLLARKLNLDVHYTVCPWKRCLSYIKTGHVDLLPGVLYRPEREEFIAYIKPHYIQDEKAFYTPVRSSLKIDQYSDVKGKTVAMVRGESAFEPYDSDKSLVKTEVNHISQAIEMSLLSRVDTFLASTIVADYTLSKRGQYDDFIKSEFRYKGTTAQGHFAISKKSSLLKRLDEFSTAMAEFKSSKAFIEINHRYSHAEDIKEYRLK